MCSHLRICKFKMFFRVLVGKYAATILIWEILQINIVTCQTFQFRRATNSLVTMISWCRTNSSRHTSERMWATERALLGRLTCGRRSIRWCMLLWRQLKMQWSNDRALSKCMGLIWSWTRHSGHGWLKWIFRRLVTSALSGWRRWWKTWVWTCWLTWNSVSWCKVTQTKTQETGRRDRNESRISRLLWA